MKFEDVNSDNEHLFKEYWGVIDEYAELKKSSIPYQHKFICEDDNTPVGVLVTQFINENDHTYTDIKFLYIFSQYRNQGYASKVVSELKKKYTHLRLICNKDTADFFISCGFKETQRVLEFSKEIEDEE